jgi:tape measure domain-containing protein
MGKDLIAKIILRLQDEASRGLDSARDRVRGVGEEIARVKQLAIGLFTFAAIKEGIGEVINLSDTYARLTGRVKQAVGAGVDYVAQQKALYDIAQRTNVALSDTTALYARSAQALKNLSNGQALAARLTEAVNLSFKAQASSAAEVSSTVTQLTQAIATDEVQWEDFGQLADTNLMLVNVAAKNLGYDGIGALKQAMSEGKVGNVEMVNAIVAGFDEIKAAADQMPVSVEAGLVGLKNKFLQYIGQSKNASEATRSIADSIGFVTQHLEQFISLGMMAGEVALAMFAANKLTSLAAYVQGLRTAAAAARADAEAAELARINTIDLLQAKAAAARASVTAHQAMVEEARLQVALAVTTKERTSATAQLTAALNALNAAQGKSVAANAALAASQGAAAASTKRLSTGVTLLGDAFNKMLGGWIAWDIGKMIGEWGLKFEWVQYVGANVAQMTAKFVAFGEVMSHPLSMKSWQDFRTELDNINAHFDGVRARIGEADSIYAESVQHVATSEQAKTQAIEAETSKQQAAFKVVQDAVKELTANIDAETKMQTASIEQGLSERLALIDAMNLSEAQKDTLRVTAKLEAAQLEIELQSKASAVKLALIDQEYQKELSGAANNAARTAEIETQKRQAKLAVYSGLAEYYQSEVNRLGGVYASEVQAAALAKQQLQGLNQSHEQALFNIKLMGMTEREKLDAEEARFNELTRNIEQEQLKGKAADHEKIKGWLTEAKGLHEQITSSVKDGADAQSDARTRTNKLYELERADLVASAQAHEASAAKTKAAQEEVAGKLRETQQTIAGITEALNQDYALKIGLDSASLSAAQSTIADLVKPETKTITIQTVNAGSGVAPAAQATGGPAGQPTGEPWRFNQGGHTPMSGKLPGYGGGDKVKALLEPGEYVVRKEAVQKLGLPFMALVNAGQVPVGDVIRRATGGLANDDKQPKWDMVSSRLLNIAQLAGRMSSKDASNNQAIASGQARANDDVIWNMMTTQVDDLVKRSGAPHIKGDAVNILRLAADEYNMHGANADMDRIKRRIQRMIDRHSGAGLQAAKNIPALPAARPLAGISDALKATPLADISQKLQQRTNALSLPMPELPTQAIAPAGQSASPNAMMRVQFASPAGEKSEGLFKQSEATAMLRVLKEAGARTV